MSDKLTVQTLKDGCDVLKTLLADIGINRAYSINAIAEMCKAVGDYQKIRRIVHTLHQVGFLSEHEDKYRISEELMFTTQKYLVSLAVLHRQIVNEAQKFEPLLQHFGQDIN